MNKQIVSRWCLLWVVSAGPTALFWWIWYLVDNEVPQVLFTLPFPEWPFRMSRWWDVLVGPLFVTLLVWFLLRRKQHDDWCLAHDEHYVSIPKEYLKKLPHLPTKRENLNFFVWEGFIIATGVGVCTGVTYYDARPPEYIPIILLAIEMAVGIFSLVLSLPSEIDRPNYPPYLMLHVPIFLTFSSALATSLIVGIANGVGLALLVTTITLLFKFCRKAKNHLKNN